jgi:hypothetical protein
VILYAKNAPFVRREGMIHLKSGAKLPPSMAREPGSGFAPKAKKKRVMSEEAKRKIGAAQAARWAKIRAQRGGG